jgi:acyl carrier protein
VKDPIAQRLIDIIRAHVPDKNPPSITLDDRLDALGIDSLGLYEAMFEIEDEYDIELPEPDDAAGATNSFQTVNDLVLAVKELMAQQREASS